MEILHHSLRNNSNGGEVDSSSESNSRQSDTYDTNFVVRLWEKFGETHRKEGLEIWALVVYRRIYIIFHYLD